MDSINYTWRDGTNEFTFRFVRVPGTIGQAYPFSESTDGPLIEVQEFFIGSTPVTQALWVHLIGRNSNPAIHQGPNLPVENVAWVELTRPRGFLEQLNASPLAIALRAELGAGTQLRLPSETEWEYAARGGPYWKDGYRFSGSDDPNAVAWYERRHGDHTQPVGRKAPNQLGLYDMSGNVWEWCQDVFTCDMSIIPANGTPYIGPGTERVLRGGCFHNWAAHCTVFKRYEIAHDFHDGCIGLRLAAAVA